MSKRVPATSAYYHKLLKKVIIDFENGTTFTFLVSSVPLLRHASDMQLSNIKVLGGDEVCFESLNDHFNIYDELMAGNFGSENNAKALARKEAAEKKSWRQ